MLTISQRQLPAVQITFLQAFGLLGVPMFLIALGCVLWTVWLICLAVAPNVTANYLMDTAELDNGTFWLIIDPDKALTVLTVIGLSLVVLGYVYVLAKMTLLRNRVGKYSRIEATASSIHSRLKSMPLPRPKLRQWARNQWFEMTNFHGHRRKYWVRTLCFMVFVGKRGCNFSVVAMIRICVTWHWICSSSPLRCIKCSSEEPRPS